MAEDGPTRKPRRWLLWIFGSIVAIILAPVILFTAYYGLAGLFAECSDAEEAALAEFPHYGGATAEPDGDVEGGCRVDLAVDAAPADVMEYYREQLKERGWTIADSAQPGGEPSDHEASNGEGSFEAGGISARRDRLFWNMSYEALEGRTITLVVHVSTA